MPSRFSALTLTVERHDGHPTLKNSRNYSQQWTVGNSARGGLATLRALCFTFTGLSLPPSPSLLPCPPLPFPPLSLPFPSPFRSIPLPLPPLRSRPLKYCYGSGGCYEFPQKWNLVDFSLKIWHLVAPILLIFLRISWPQCMHVRMCVNFLH